MNREIASLARLSALAVALIAARGAAAAPADGAALYEERCASCHDHPVERTPPRNALRAMPPGEIAAALTEGAMKPQAEGLSEEQIRDLATHLSGRRPGAAEVADVQPNACKKPAPKLALKGARWNGWGRDLENTRYQPEPGLRAADVRKLKLRWAYAYPGRSAIGQPTLAGGRLYVTSATGRVSALDPRSGCEHWTYEAGSGVKSAIVVGEIALEDGKKRFAAFFGDQRAFAHAVDAETGEPLWKTQLEEHPAARVTGSPAFHDGRVYFPLSSHEEGSAGDPRYPCCSFRGSVAALDARSGALLWKAHAIQEEPKAFRTSSAGTQMNGPAGGAIWSAPTIDAKRGLLYAATGNSYTDVDTDGSDAIVAFDLATGERRWVRQLTANDNFVLRCAGPGQDNCPQERGGDFDFGSSPMLKTLPGGKQLLLASQKSGFVHALDPDDAGKVVWQVQVGRGSALGGIQFGPGADAENLYVAVSDAAVRRDPLPGLTALRIATGEKLWRTPTPEVKCAWGANLCGRGQPGAVTVIPGVVFSGALDGHIRAYATKDGSIVWDFDTAPARQTVNGGKVEGGSIDGGGAIVANGVVYVNSGYGLRSKRGRLLLAFTVNGK